MMTADVDAALCCPHGRGWFTNADTRTIERCDACRRFADDDDAALFVAALVSCCEDCAADFDETTRSNANPSLCRECFDVD
ncbi:MAG: hypothetical protein JNM69_06770 [Archangium sp.]|nr:hypothetical protein [Archangium sp.]